MNALKALVIGMGILILAGVAVLGVTIYRRASTDAAPAAVNDPRPQLGLARAAAPFGSRDVPLAAGETVVSVEAGNGYVAVHLKGADGTVRILLLDPATGERFGEWRMQTPGETGRATP